MEQYEKLLVKAIDDLLLSVRQVSSYGLTQPITTVPRPKYFQLAHNVSWPSKEKGFDHVEAGQVQEFLGFSSSLADMIARQCKYQPRQILRALHQIRAATAWCDARIGGRRRAAEEIMLQQAAAIEALDAEMAMATLGK